MNYPLNLSMLMHYLSNAQEMLGILLYSAVVKHLPPEAKIQNLGVRS